ncbi:aminodeoxychorismate/anthranilate synthase component II [Chelatococcus sp. SYSU_G07232]|uniref:Aminodeoxychorismate/anthranilate synthase component II n=1 Tax=Chelatococcus albus TaxID=3047466 RepID=A0ABT7AF24_9HYPH|nr:aminodeoxychorismate/anthranilate synthase component II [Chelatococcus sp. SYSU_G07232]MDJ1157971.1 aminodeoxychorismate/anthranilate synthase component II [Chelatococcus sp. SYSU_G07232]
MIVVIDNYDSFVFTVARYLRELGAEAQVIRNDAMGIDDLLRLSPAAIVISPGPGTPDDAGISTGLVSRLTGRLPILGICLGHQCIGAAFGGRVVRARRPLHGRASAIMHGGTDIFAGLPSPLEAGRYHSLTVELDEDDDGPLVPTAWSDEGEIMALRHREAPTFGVQFHPESILTVHGHALLANFLRFARDGGAP